MKKNRGRTKLVLGRLNPVITLSDCENYTAKTLKNSLQNSHTTPNNGSVEL